MNSFSGFASAALQMGFESVLFSPVRGIYSVTLDDGSTLPDIIADCTIEERHHDRLEVTEHPVEVGAMISDHAYKHPAELMVKMGWSNSPGVNGSILNAALGYAAATSPTVARVVGALNEIGGLLSAAEQIQSALNGNDPSQINAVYDSLLNLQTSKALFNIYTGKRAYVNMVCTGLATETDEKTANILSIVVTCKQVILVSVETIGLSKTTQANPEITASTIGRGILSAIQK